MVDLPIDGIAGPNTRVAIEKYEAYARTHAGCEVTPQPSTPTKDQGKAGKPAAPESGAKPGDKPAAPETGKDKLTPNGENIDLSKGEFRGKLKDGTNVTITKNTIVVGGVTYDIHGDLLSAKTDDSGNITINGSRSKASSPEFVTLPGANEHGFREAVRHFGGVKGKASALAAKPEKLTETSNVDLTKEVFHTTLLDGTDVSITSNEIKIGHTSYQIF